eukprot:COSAG02_NODE_1249_length_13624_cov_4.621600_4_plen_435_part_00
MAEPAGSSAAALPAESRRFRADWWSVGAPGSSHQLRIPTQRHVHRSFTSLLEPQSHRYVVERYNTGALADGQHGGGSGAGDGTHAQQRRRRWVLDVGCGDGRVAIELARSCGCDVVGVDVNEAAVAAANAAAAAAQLHPRAASAAGGSSSGDDGKVDTDGGSAVFVVGDCRSVKSLAAAVDAGLVRYNDIGDAGNVDKNSGFGFDFVLAQLVVSVVGTPSDRTALIHACHSQLRPGGKLMLSASAVSHDLNPALYSALYEHGKEQTGEEHSYSLAEAYTQQKLLQENVPAAAVSRARSPSPVLTEQGEEAEPPAEFAGASISPHESIAMCTGHQHDFSWAELVDLVTKARTEPGSHRRLVDGPCAHIAGGSTTSASQRRGGIDGTGGEAAMFELVAMVKEKDVSMSLSMEMDVTSDERSATCEAWFLYVVAERR